MLLYKVNEKQVEGNKVPDVETVDTFTGNREGYSMKDVKSPVIGTRDNMKVISRTEYQGLCVDIL